jgi:hypothetical protein
MIFLLNLEIAYCCPPLGLNLFIASFRFNRPVVSLYRVVLPFAGILACALLLVSYIPRISDVLILGDIAQARAEAAKVHLPPRDAWIMECVQEDRTNPMPCTPEDKKAWPNGQAPESADSMAAAATAAAAPSAAQPDAGSGDESDEDLAAAIFGGAKDGGAAKSDAGGAAGEPSDDDLAAAIFGPKDAGAAKPAAAAATAEPTDDELNAQIFGTKPKDGG